MEDDGFVGATLERDRHNGGGDQGFDASAYTFFGDLDVADDALESGGALEEGLEAPPEEVVPDADLLLDDDEDLSYASMFAAQFDADRGAASAASGSGAAKGCQQLGAASSPEPPMFSAAPTPPAASADRSRSGSLFQDFDLAGPTPPRAQLGSIALGGLLAGNPGSPFGSVPSSSPFGGFGSAGMPTPSPPQHQPSPLQDPGYMHMGAPPPVVASLPGVLGGHMAPGALTAQELEAQLLGGSAGGQHLQQHQQQLQQQQQQMYQHPPPMLPQQQMPYMGMPLPPQQQHNGFPPGMQHMGGPPPGYGMPPPGHMPGHHMQGPPGHHMQPPPPQGPPRPQFSPGAAFPPMDGRPPPRPIPMQHPGMFGAGPPGMHGPPPPPGPGPHHQQQQHMMGGGPRPPPPGMFPPPHMQPGGPGMGPPPPHQHFHMRPGPPGPWGQRPPMGMQPGVQPPPPQQQQQRMPQLQQATLAQRLRALNLADRHEEMRRPMLRRRYYSQYMDHEEIEHILHMQWRGLHQGSPYLEDYYYQAFVYKYYAKRNRRSFAPESVRELAPTEKMAPDEVAFVKVEGLGRLPFSNIRRPRPLMDIAPDELRRKTEDADSGKEGEEGGEGGSAALAAPARPLEQEPMLAARIMIEDCMCLILDVLDIDQIFVAAAGGPVENEAALRMRRVLLLEGLAASLRLPDTAVVAPPTPGARGGAASGEAGDGVFLRLMALPKGKKLLGRALRVVYPSPEGAQPRPPPQVAEGEATALPQRPNLRVVWAALRNLRSLFAGRPGASGGAAEDTAVTSAVAAAAADVLRRLHSPQAVADCLAAVMGGDLDGAPMMDWQADAVLMPLYAPGGTAHDTQRPWLSDVLMALLQRAAELDLLPATVAAEEAQPAAAAWRQQLPKLYALVERHVSALQAAYQAGMAMGEAEAAAEVKALVPISLVRVLLPHCTKEQGTVLRSALQDLGI